MSFSPDSELGRLLATISQRGRVQWIGLRPARGVDMLEVDAVEALTEKGLRGDRYKSASGKRGITLIQAEHLPAIAALSGHDAVLPSQLRRNVLVSGIALIALKDREFRIGDLLLQGTGPCEPCSMMEAALGPGGYNAMRGHGGICARVVQGGVLHIGDEVRAA